MQSARTIIEAGKTSRHTDKGVVDFFFQLSVMLLQQQKKSHPSKQAFSPYYKKRGVKLLAGHSCSQGHFALFLLSHTLSITLTHFT